MAQRAPSFKARPPISYGRMAEVAFVLIGDDVKAEVAASEALAEALRRTAPDGLPPSQRALRRLSAVCTSAIRRRRLGAHFGKRTKVSTVDVEAGAATTWAAVRTLPARVQMAVVLARMEGASLAELADALDCSAPSARSYLESGRRRLEEALGAETAELRSLLTRDLNAVAASFTRLYRPNENAARVWISSARRWVLKASGALIVLGGGAWIVLELTR